MQKIIGLTIAMLAASQASAQCIGSRTLSSCINSRTGDLTEIQRIGSTSFIDGSNPRTGETWSETTQDLGNIQMRSGRTGDGRNYDSMTHDLGSTAITTGTDASGKSITCITNALGTICN